jgi:tetratricopeptide (TPR) repeat protein
MKVSVRICVSILMILFLAVTLSYGQSAAKKHLTKGVDYAAQGRFEEAKEEFEKALKADPSSEFAEDSLKVIKDVTDKKIESKTAIHYFKGVAHSLNGQRDEAIAEYDKAIELNPKLAMAYVNRGFAYDGKGLYDQAISDYTKAIELNPGFAGTYFNRGRAYLSKGQYDRAISDYSKAVELNPNFAWAYLNRGLAYYYKGEHDKAWEDVHKVQSLGSQVHPDFLKDLREASGRQECGFGGAGSAGFGLRHISSTEYKGWILYEL